MFSHYASVNPQAILRLTLGEISPLIFATSEIWPGNFAPFLRSKHAAEISASSSEPTDFEVTSGLFGLVPSWAENINFSLHSFHANIETVSKKPNFRDAWKLGHHCIIPVQCVYYPIWKNGRSAIARVHQKNGHAMGVAGLWSYWNSPSGLVYSFAMLSTNGDHLPMMNSMYRSFEEKRMVLSLPPECFKDWLRLPSDQSLDFIDQFSNTAKELILTCV